MQLKRAHLTGKQHRFPNGVTTSQTTMPCMRSLSSRAVQAHIQVDTDYSTCTIPKGPSITPKALPNIVGAYGYSSQTPSPSKKHQTPNLASHFFRFQVSNQGPLEVSRPFSVGTRSHGASLWGSSEEFAARNFAVSESAGSPGFRFSVFGGGGLGPAPKMVP